MFVLINKKKKKSIPSINERIMSDRNLQRRTQNKKKNKMVRL